MNQTIVPIKGMHCRSCEVLIEEKLKEIPGLKGIFVSYKKSRAGFYSSQHVDMNVVKRAVEEAGYQIGNDQKAWISHNPSDYRDLGIAFVALLILYFIAKKTGLTNLNVGSTGSPSGLLVVLIVGLTAGISTCMAMVGGLVLGISARHSEKHPEATPAQKFRPHLFFNLGRILSYFLLGGLIGVIGKAFQLSSTTLGALIIIVGLVMLVLGIQLTQIFPKISSAGFTLPSGIAKLLGIKKHHDKEYSHLNSMLVGALTFFLPCGFTQAMQLYAMSTGSFWRGAAIMGVFALGTAPGLLGIGGLTSLIKGMFARRFFKFAGILVIFLALFNISNGINLTGIRSINFNSASESQAKDDPNVKLENGVQTVRMTQSSAGYTPNKFTIKKGIPVKWIIDAKNTSSCSSSIVAQKINIKKFLSPGENVFEFTPTETGEIRFTCSMGMYAGKFIVVEDTTSLDISTEKSKSIATKPTDTATTTSPSAKPQADVQLIKTTYLSPREDISPKEFKVAVNKPVKFEILAKADGQGCMGTIAVPGLINTPEFLEKDKTVTFEFTPQNKGAYYITCAMGVPRGKIVVE